MEHGNRAWIRPTRDGRFELNARAGKASLRLFSTREVCMRSFAFFKDLHSVDMPLTDWGEPTVIEGQTSIADFLTA